MAFNTAPGRSEYTASAAQTIFTFTFKIFETSNVKAYLTPANQAYNDATDILIETTDYTVSINGDNGGDVTLTSGATLNDRITLVRSLPADRDAEYQQNGDLTAEALNEDQDYQTYLILDGVLIKERALIFQDSVQNVSSELPSPEPTKVLGWNVLGSALENYTVGTDDVFINILNVDNVTDLIAVSTLIHATVNVRGYYSPNDGGGGVFNYDSTQSAVNNGGTIINGWVRQYYGAINARWFGAEDGENSATAIANAISVSNNIFIPSGSYNLEANIIVEKDINIFGESDTKLIDTTALSTPMLTLGGVSPTQLTGVSSDITIGDSSFISVSSETLVEGDIVMIFNPTDFSYNGARDYYRAGEMVEVLSVSGTTVNIVGSFVENYALADIETYKMNNKKVVLRDIELVANTSNSYTHPLYIVYAEHSILENVTTSKGKYAGCSIKSSFNINVSNCNFNNNNDKVNIGTNYGLAVLNSQNVNVSSSSMYGHRHGFTLTGGGDFSIPNRFVIVENCKTYSDVNQSLDMHGNVDNIKYLNNFAENGIVIGGKNVDVVGNTVYGNIVSDSMCYFGDIIGGGYYRVEDNNFTINGFISNRGNFIHLAGFIYIVDKIDLFITNNNVKFNDGGIEDGSATGILIQDTGGSGSSEMNIYIIGNKIESDVAALSVQMKRIEVSLSDPAQTGEIIISNNNLKKCRIEVELYMPKIIISENNINECSKNGILINGVKADLIEVTSNKVEYANDGSLVLNGIDISNRITNAIVRDNIFLHNCLVGAGSSSLNSNVWFSSVGQAMWFNNFCGSDVGSAQQRDYYVDTTLEFNVGSNVLLTGSSTSVINTADVTNVI